MNISESGKIQYLEGLRGIAALMVVINHLIDMFYPAALWGEKHVYRYPAELLISKSPAILLYSGVLAVVIFFILSGFVLSYKFMRIKDRGILISGMIKRYFRLTIPIAFSCMMAYFLMKFKIIFNSNLIENTHLGALSNFYAFKPDFLKALYDSFIGVYLNPVLWTMSFELYGSFIVFLSLFSYLIFPKKRQVYLFYAILASVLLILNSLLMLGCFILGLILCDLFVSGKLPQVKNKFYKVFLLVLSLYLCSFPYVKDIKTTMWGILDTSFMSGQLEQISYLIIGAFILVYLILTSKRLQKFLNIGFARFLGKISFSMYIMHLLIIMSLTSALFKYLIKYLPYDICALIASGVTIPIIFAVSWFVYKYVDLPSIKFSNFINNRIKSLYNDIFLATKRIKQI
jgi:peptidoglycan/LPS O-acetylase OafA/YrhL